MSKKNETPKGYPWILEQMNGGDFWVLRDLATNRKLGAINAGVTKFYFGVWAKDSRLQMEEVVGLNPDDVNRPPITESA